MFGKILVIMVYLSAVSNFYFWVTLHHNMNLVVAFASALLFLSPVVMKQITD